PDGFLSRERPGVVPEPRGKRIRSRGHARRGARRGPAPGPKARGGASARRASRASRCAARGLSAAAGGRNVDRANRRGDRRRPGDREEPPALCCGEAACELGEGIMIERRDEELSHIYRDAEGPRPPQRVDDNILAASQRVASTVRRPAGFGFSRRWGTPVALAATVLVTFTLALMVFERQSGLDAIAPKAPGAVRPAKVSPPEATRASPAEPKRGEALARSPVAEPPRADSPQKSPSVALTHAAPAPAAPSPQAAPRSDKVKPPTVETALSGERRGTGQPARVPAIPPGVEILRKSEEAKPMPDAQRVFEAQQPNQAVQAPPAAAPAPGANTPRESASAVQGAASGLASRVAASEAKERAPEKWLADIRKLKTDGKATEAERELAEFKKRYPDYILPEDLR